jgi:Tol biopolymer transport system component
VTDWPDSDAINPAWSPDGRKIAFLRVWRERGERVRIYTMNADGTGVRKLTNAGDAHAAAWGTHP